MTPSLKSLASLAAAVMATSAWAAAPADAKCGAGTCGKKEKVAPKPGAAGKDAACSKHAPMAKDAGAKDMPAKETATKDAACSKKEAACSKKDAACAKK